MKRFCVLLPLFFVMLSCTRDWNNPFETDSDLSHPPVINNIQLDNGNRLMLYLDYSYSSDCTLLFERKSASAFDPVNLLQVTTSVYADTTLNMEQNYNLAYRLRVKKNGYTSDYSPEKQFSYISNVINAPSGLSCSSIELQGVRLNWTDNSSKETGYRIEKNVNGSGFAEAADLPANTTTWLDAITGMPDPPQSIIYRIRAYNATLNSVWAEQNVIYSGLGAPSNLHITNSHFWEFTIAWTRNSTIATGYQIERKKESGTWSVVGSVGASTSIYTEMVLENGSYNYRVRAMSDVNYSTYSNIITNIVNNTIPIDGLVAYYPFNGNANDESGNGHNGTLHGATLSSDRNGISNTASSFNGVSDYIISDTFSSSNVHYSTLTISLWFMYRSWDEHWVVFLSKDNSAAVNQYASGITDENEFWLRLRGINIRVSSPQITPNTWYHFVTTWDGSIVFFYLNGQLSGQTSCSVSGFDNASNPLYLGIEIPYNIEYLNGKLDDIRIYNRALSEIDIQALYHEGGWTGAK